LKGWHGRRASDHGQDSVPHSNYKRQSLALFERQGQPEKIHPGSNVLKLLAITGRIGEHWRSFWTLALFEGYGLLVRRIPEIDSITTHLI
jgi:hypothetical protein